MRPARASGTKLRENLIRHLSRAQMINRQWIFAIILLTPIAAAAQPRDELTCADWNRALQLQGADSSQRLFGNVGQIMRRYSDRISGVAEANVVVSELNVACTQLRPDYDTMKLTDLIASIADPHWFILSDCAHCTQQSQNDHRCHPAAELGGFNTPEKALIVASALNFQTTFRTNGSGISLTFASPYGPQAIDWYPDQATCEVIRRTKFGPPD
jgi:hypothetical protein